MPRRSGRGFGDLYLTFEVDFPDSLSEDQMTKLKDILPARGEEVSSKVDAFYGYILLLEL